MTQHVSMAPAPDGPLAKRQRTAHDVARKHNTAVNGSRIFAPFRTVGLVSPTDVPFTSVPLGKKTYQITTSVGRALQTYDLLRGLNLVFVSRPETPQDITASLAHKQQVYAAWGGLEKDAPRGLWVYERGSKVGDLALPAELQEPVQQIMVFGQWLMAVATTRIEVFKTASREHYTTIHITGAANQGHHITGGVVVMPTYLNKVFVGRRDGWVEIWNVKTARLIYTILPPSPDCGPVTCLEPSPALDIMAIAYRSGHLVLQNVLVDKPVLSIQAGTKDAPVHFVSFRTDGAGAGVDGRKEGVMATASTASGDVTFWDLNDKGRRSGVLAAAHNPPGARSRGGVSKIEFLPDQAVIVTSGRDNALRTWIFDKTPFSPVPRMLHTRSGHAGSVNCLHFLPSDFDGAESGNKWLMSGGQDRSLWGWSLRRDGQSTELSQGQIRSKAKKTGLVATHASIAHGSRGMTTALEDLKAPEITCIATSLNRDGGIGALPGKNAIWQKNDVKKTRAGETESSGMTGWESVVTAHKGDRFARTWFWGRKVAGRWAFSTGDGSNVSTIAMTSCGTFALLGSEEGSIKMFNLQSGIARQKFPAPVTPQQAKDIKAQLLKRAQGGVRSAQDLKFLPGTGKHTQAITGLVVDNMNKTVVSCSLDGTVKFWDFVKGVLLDQLDWSALTTPTGCRYHAGSNLLALSCQTPAGEWSVRVVDMETKRTIREFWGPHDTINDLCFSNDGRWIIAASADRVIRVWDLPTSHLIDAIRLEKPCKAIAMSSTGEYLAATAEDTLGVMLWTNKALFKHVPTRQISEREVATTLGPSTSGEGNKTLVEGAFDDDGGDDDDALAAGMDVVAPAVDQLSADMTTLSLVPKSRWQTLLHLDVIKQRNKPTEAPKLPEKAPFFLPSTTGRANQSAGSEKTAGGEDEAAGPDGKSRITALDRARLEELFATKLRDAGASGDYSDFIDHLKTLSPSSADLELRSLTPGLASDPASNELLHFILALTSRLRARRDYELVQVWMTVFLRLHFDTVMAREELLAALKAWRAVQAGESRRLDDLVGYCSGVVGFLRSPRT